MNPKVNRFLRITSKIVLVLTGLFLLGYAVYATYMGIRFKPYKVRVTNVTDSAFTVSWITDSPMPGIVYYSDKKVFLPGPLAWLGKKKAVDDRDYSDATSECVSKFNKKAAKNRDANFTVDASGFNCNDVKVWRYGKYYTHHVTIKNLDPEKEYYFRVGDGYISYGENGGTYKEREPIGVEVFSQKTKNVITNIGSPDPAYGTIYNIYKDEDDFLREKKVFDSMVFLVSETDGKKYEILSSVVNMDGGWSIDLANIRDSEGNLVSLEGVDLEFIAQAENFPAYSDGLLKYSSLSLPLHLAGNKEEDWETELETEETLGSKIRDLLVKSSFAQAGPCYKCENGVIVTRNRFKGVCPYGFTWFKPKCEPVKKPAGSEKPKPKVACYGCDSNGNIVTGKSVSSDERCEKGFSTVRPTYCPKPSSKPTPTTPSTSSNNSDTSVGTTSSSSCHRGALVAGSCAEGDCWYELRDSKGNFCNPKYQKANGGNCRPKNCLNDYNPSRNDKAYCVKDGKLVLGEREQGKETCVPEVNITCWYHKDATNCGSVVLSVKKGVSCSQVDSGFFASNPCGSSSAGETKLCWDDRCAFISVPKNASCSKTYPLDKKPDNCQDLAPIKKENQCYDTKQNVFVDCKTCGQNNCISTGEDFESLVEDNKKRGFVLVPLSVQGAVSYRYVKDRDYQAWFNNCIQTGESQLVDYSNLSSPNFIVKDKKPDCPKVNFDYLPGKDFGSMEIYNYKTLQDIGDTLGLTALGLTLSQLFATGATTAAGGSAAAITATTAAAGGSAATSSAAASILSAELAAAKITLPQNLYKAGTEIVAKILASEGLAAAKHRAMQIAVQRLGDLTIANAGGTAALTAGGRVLITPVASSALTTTGGSLVATGGTGLATTTGSTALTAGGSAAATAGGVSGAAIAGGVVAAVGVALGAEALTHLEYTYEQCATVVDGVVTYTIQPRYCEKTRTGVKWESTLCGCEGSRTEMKKSTSPVFEVNYYINEDKSFEACAGSDCEANEENESLNLLDPKSKEEIVVGDETLICCKEDNQPKTYAECQPKGLFGERKTEWGKCVKVDTISISGSLLLNLDNWEIANRFDKEGEFRVKNKQNTQSTLDKLFGKVSASENEEEVEQHFLPYESGLYKVTLIGGAESYLLKEGNMAVSYYIERNGITGYQSPENPYKPMPHEDLAISESSVIISVTKKAKVYEKELKKGINIISFDSFLTNSSSENPVFNSADFLYLVNANGDNISRISYFSGGQWNGGTTYDFEKKETKGVPFDLVPGKGYVVVAERDTTISVPGYEIKEPITAAFSKGWNLIGINGYPTRYTARSLIDSINTTEGLKANNVTYWPTEKGMYEGFQLVNGQEYGLDYPISPDLGYFVRINEYTKPECKSVWWSPGSKDHGKCDK